jgi:hypothetical protein
MEEQIEFPARSSTDDKDLLVIDEPKESVEDANSIEALVDLDEIVPTSSPKQDGYSIPEQLKPINQENEPSTSNALDEERKFSSNQEFPRNALDEESKVVFESRGNNFIYS